MATNRVTRARLNVIRALTVSEFFQLSQEERTQVEGMLSKGPVSKSISKASKPPTGSKPSGVSKPAPTASNFTKFQYYVAAAAKVLADIVSSNKQADGGSEGGNTGDKSKSGAPSGGGSSGGGSTTVLVKRNGINVERGIPVIPQGVVDGQIGKTFPQTRHISPAGINRNGYRCYRNSLLQCLFHTPEFYHLLGIIHKDCPLQPEECITCALQEMAQDYWNGDRDTDDVNYNGDVLQQALKKVITQDDSIQGNEQSDPYDLMMFIVRYVEWDAYGIDPVGKGFVSQPLDSNDESSLSFRELFYFEYEESWTCKECGKKHPALTVYEMGVDLLVDIRRSPGSSLESYLQDRRINLFRDPVRVRCNSEVCARSYRNEIQNDPKYEPPFQTRYRRIIHAPEILILRLRRFTMEWTPPIVSTTGKVLAPGRWSGNKCTQNISYEEGLDLSKYSAWQDDKIQYDLRGVVSHDGMSVQSGHYVADVLRLGPENTYNHIDDTRVGRPSRDRDTLLDPILGDPFVLIYSKVATEPEEEAEEDDA